MCDRFKLSTMIWFLTRSAAAQDPLKFDFEVLTESMSQVALSELLGAAVRDAGGAVKGRVRDIAIAPQEHATRVAFLIVRTPAGERVLPAGDVSAYGATVRATTDSAGWER